MSSVDKPKPQTPAPLLGPESKTALDRLEA